MVLKRQCRHIKVKVKEASFRNGVMETIHNAQMTRVEKKDKPPETMGQGEM